MQNFKKEYRKLYKIYKARLKKQTREILKGTLRPEETFILNLRLLHDIKVLTAPVSQSLVSNDTELDPAVVSLIAAIDEYEQYKQCIFNYYAPGAGGLIHLPQYDATEAAEKFAAEQRQHWEQFWDLVALYSEDWKLND